MPTNFYFQSGNTSGTTNEQRLLEDLVIESMKIYGHDVYYMPRTIINQDPIFNQDPIGYFNQYYPLEMYLENTEGFEGQGELLTKFGYEFKSTATFVVAKRRWEESVGRNADNLTLPERPAEGDVLFFPKTKTFFVINYVDFLNPFYQLGKIYTFKLVCEVWDYSSELVDTNNSEIDSSIQGLTQDQLQYRLLTQENDNLVDNYGHAIILEQYGHQTNSTVIDDTDAIEAEAAGILDFTAFNPFGEVQVK
jgi:hypothetical protein